MSTKKPGKGSRYVARWPSFMVFITIGIIYFLVPEQLAVGPSWLLLGLIVLILIPLHLAHARDHHDLVRWLVLILLGAVTLMVASSALLLLTQLPGRRTSAPWLLVDAALIWVANVLTFALWYWEIDSGGPVRRGQNAYTSTDFVFPQMAAQTPSSSSWSPALVDYLFLAFNTSTAFSPTDTMVLSRRAKLLMMGQSLISLVVVVVLAARAVNTL